MKFVPKTEQEIASENLLQPGTYDFEIKAAEDAISKASGAEMIKLTVHVFSEDGTPTTVFDYLMESVAYRLRHAAEVCGLMADYERGELDAVDFTGKTGRCKVAIERDKGGQYADKNKIVDYIKTLASAGATRAPSARKPAHAGVGSDLDDEIPF